MKTIITECRIVKLYGPYPTTGFPDLKLRFDDTPRVAGAMASGVFGVGHTVHSMPGNMVHVTFSYPDLIKTRMPEKDDPDFPAKYSEAFFEDDVRHSFGQLARDEATTTTHLFRSHRECQETWNVDLVYHWRGEGENPEEPDFSKIEAVYEGLPLKGLSYTPNLVWVHRGIPVIDLSKQ